MKTVFAMAALTLVSATSFAVDCLTQDGLVIAHGTSAVMYHTQSPRTQFGPMYDCARSSRVRTCDNGQLSVIPRECSQYDSGGCVDSWDERLEDTQFIFATCKD